VLGCCGLVEEVGEVLGERFVGEVRPDRTASLTARSPMMESPLSDDVLLA